MSCIKRETALPSSSSADGRDFNAYSAMQPRAPDATPAEAKNGGRVKSHNVPPEGVYLPNNNRLAPHMRSPEYVQMSTAAAITLGVMSGKMHRCSCTRCLNLLLTYPEGCRANCASADWRVIAKPTATMPTATSSALTGQLYRWSKLSRSLRVTAAIHRSTACAFR